MCSYFFFLALVTVQWGLICKTKGNLLGISNSSKKNKIFIVLTCIELITFASLRADSIGADTRVYLAALDYYKSLPHNTILTADLVYPFDFEIGYFMFTKICAWLNFNHTAFLAIIAAIIYIPIFRFIEYNSEHSFISLMVYFAFGFFGYSLGIFRQMIAISILLCGAGYIKEKKLRKYLIVVFFAVLFHTTAIIALPLYFVYKINIRSAIKYIFVLEIVAFIFGRQIIEIILKIFPSYAGYIGSRFDVQDGSYMMLALLNILMILGSFVLCCHKNNSSEMQLSVKAVMIACILQAMGYSMEIFGRIVPYYSIYSIILIPMLINVFFSKQSKWLVSIIITILLLIIFYLITYNGVALCPYKFFWERF